MELVGYAYAGSGQEWSMKVQATKLVTVIGAARSGTRIVRDTIASHTSVSCVPYDINYVWKLGSSHIPHDALEISDISIPQAEAIRKSILRFKQPDTNWLVEKTVSNTLRVSFVQQIADPHAYVLVLRHPVDVIESAVRQWQASPDWRQALRKLKRYPKGGSFRYLSDYTLASLRRGRSRSPVAWGPIYPKLSQQIQSGASVLELATAQWSSSLVAAVTGFDELRITPQILHYSDFCQEPERFADLNRTIGIPEPTTEALSQVTTSFDGLATHKLDRSSLEYVLDQVEQTLSSLSEGVVSQAVLKVAEKW